MPDTVSKKLFDLRVAQAMKRDKLFQHFELDELRAMKFLAYRLYGNRGLLELDPNFPGIIHVGYYIDPPLIGRPPNARRRKLVLRGHSHAELLAQAKLLDIGGVVGGGGGKSHA